MNAFKPCDCYICRLQYEYIPVRGPAVVSTGALYERYIKYTEAAGFKPLSRSRLGCLVLKIFPSVRVKRNNNREYEGLRLNFGDNTAGTGEMFKTEANNFGFIKMTDNGESSAYCLFTGFQINGNEVLKILKFNQDGTWSLRVRGIVVDPALIGLSDIKGDNLFAIRTVLNMVKQTRICKGRLVTSKKDSNRNSKFQEWTQTGNENSQTHRASSASCQGVTLLLGEGELCFSCQKQKFTQPSNKQTNNSEDADTLISKLFPTANELMIKFLKTQSEICQKSADKLDSRSRRWDKDIIQVALSIWNRSPQGYNNLRDSNMFQLPSESLLQRYKNGFSQQPGLNDNMFTWMYNEAVRFKCDRFGGIVLDEMAIQEDLKMAFGNNKISLDGLVDLGSTCSNMHLLNTHCNDIRLASHILQFIFLGYDGFRFPFAYYPTTGANAPEMFVILWEAIGKLSTFDFTVDYVSFDGASNNRSLQMMHFRQI